jgi:hypothetical protein
MNQTNEQKKQIKQMDQLKGWAKGTSQKDKPYE